MANLVAPVNVLEPIEEKIIDFRGLNRKSSVEDGEMHDMLNMASDKYPLLAPRPLRGTYKLPNGILRPLNIICRYNKLAMIAKESDGGIGFYYDGDKKDIVNDLTESSYMVAINTKICFFPQKKYIDAVSEGTEVTIGSEYKSLEETFDNSSGGTGNIVNVDIYEDEVTMTLPRAHNFGYDDAVNIMGSLFYISEGSQTTTDIVISAAILSVSGNEISLPANSFIELIGEDVEAATFTGTIKRTIPDMDLIIEWNNRLWGASNIDNTIYASKLGDPTNFQYFQSTGLDSYYAQQGTDGQWTGVAPYSGHLVFFKENSMCKIYGTAPANYQITNAECYGVEEGSRKSVVTINDTVFYKSQIGIMAYDGSVPYCISEKFNKKFKNVVGGTEGVKYYASIQIEGGSYELMVLDIDKAVWHKEDGTRLRDTCTMNNRLHYISYDDGMLICSNDIYCDDYLIMGSDDEEGYIGIANPVTPSESYDDMDWMAEFGPFDEYLEEHKIYSKLSLRAIVYSGTTMNVYIKLNDGEWELVKAFAPLETHGEVIPIVPRRCDRYSVKLEGRGNCEIKSLTRRIRKGTFGKL